MFTFDVRRTRRFFRPVHILGYIGGGLIVLGIPMYLMTMMFFAAIPFVAAGIVCIVVDREINESVSDFTEITERMRQDFEKQFSEDHYDVKHPERRMKVHVLSAFVTKDENTLVRRSAKGTPVTSQYRLCGIGILEDRLIIRILECDLLSETLPEPQEHEYLFSACGAVSCQPPEANTPAMLIMTDCNGDRILETAVPFDHETDVLVEDLNALIAKASAKE